MWSKRRIIIKWLFDRTFSLVGLIVCCPVILIISLAIKIKMGDGPIFFKQKRIGQFGKPFTLVKFRTMTPDCPGPSVTVFNDARITNFGSFLRRYKIDEIPELWNVLKGEMSFVGPRPDVEGYADKLEGENKKILMLKPGITGPATLKYCREEELLAQQNDPLKYNDEVIWPDKVKINMLYLDNISLRGDIKIIFQTLGLIR